MTHNLPLLWFATFSVAISTSGSGSRECFLGANLPQATLSLSATNSLCSGNEVERTSFGASELPDPGKIRVLGGATSPLEDVASPLWALVAGPTVCEYAGQLRSATHAYAAIFSSAPTDNTDVDGDAKAEFPSAHHASLPLSIIVRALHAFPSRTLHPTLASAKSFWMSVDAFYRVSVEFAASTSQSFGP